MGGDPLSIVEYFSKNRGSSCGYCKSKLSSQSHGLWGHVLTPADYQAMIDRGWRRSGRYCYKPLMEETCCPQYPIRCDVLNFRPSKSHHKIIKRFVNYVVDDAGASKRKPLDPAVLAKLEAVDGDDDDPVETDDDDDEDDQFSEGEEPCVKKQAEDAGKRVKLNLEEDLGGDRGPRGRTEGGPRGPHQGPSLSSSTPPPPPPSTLSAGKVSETKPGQGPDPSKPRARKAKDVRRERALLKKKQGQPVGHQADGQDLKADHSPEKNMSSGRTADDARLKALDELTNLGMTGGALNAQKAKHRFEVKLVRAQMSDPEFKASFDQSLLVYRKYQTVVHKDKPGVCTSSQFQRFLCNSSLVDSDRKSPSSGRLFSRWDPAGLIPPLLPPGYGAFHLQFWLDGRIICVGVVDVLPRCLSSVYFYYDPEFSFLTLGTLSTLFEISFTRKLAAGWHPDLHYYYMGFYIHSCHKMRYKAQYDPSWLLCPQTYDWVDVALACPLLDVSKYSRLAQASPEGQQVDREAPTEGADDLNSVMVLYRHQIVPYQLYTELKASRESGDFCRPDSDRVVAEYVKLVGRTLSCRMALYRP